MTSGGINGKIMFDIGLLKKRLKDLQNLKLTMAYDIYGNELSIVYILKEK